MHYRWVTCWDGVAGYQDGVAAVTAAPEVKQAAAGHSTEDSTVLLDSDSEVRYPPFTSRPVCVCVCVRGGGGGGGGALPMLGAIPCACFIRILDLAQRCIS